MLQVGDTGRVKLQTTEANTHLAKPRVIFSADEVNAASIRGQIRG